MFLIPLLKGQEYHGEWMMDWLDKLSMAAIVGLTVIAIGMLANHEIIKRRHDNPGTEAKNEKGSYALQMETDKKIYQEVASYKEQGLYTEAMAKLEDIRKKYPEKPMSYVYLAQLYLEEGRLADGIHNYRRAVEMEPDYVDERTPLFIGDKIKELVIEGREKFGREKALKPKDKKVMKTLKDIYYLQSRVAGGCE
jgi:tetratricopeptide (TPR) repeat protein